MRSLRALTRLLVVGCSFLILVAPFLVLAPSQEAYAASRTWDGGGNGEDWGDCNNWSGNECPTGTDSIRIGSGADVFVGELRLLSGGSLLVSSGAWLAVASEIGNSLNQGTIHNSGTIAYYSDEHGNFFVNEHVIINDGAIFGLYGRGAFSNEPSGTIQNNAGGLIAGYLENGGNIVNKCGGTFDASIIGNDVMDEPCTAISFPCNNPTLIGTDGNDIIEGKSGADVIDAKGGDDVIYGFGGNDLICGGSGNDSISGGAGNDLIFGGHGNDIINGGLGHDRLNGGAGNDSLAGNGGDDALVGSFGNDKLNSKDGIGLNDFIDGGIGTDTCDIDRGANIQSDPAIYCEVFPGF